MSPGFGPGCTAVLALLVLCLLPPVARAETRIDQGVSVRVVDPGPPTLVVDARRLDGSAITQVSASLSDGTALAATSAPRADLPTTSAALFMVDVSDPRRAESVRTAAATIARLVETAPARLSAALARFDRGIEVVAGFDQERPALVAALSALQALGRETALYESLIDGVRILAESGRTRRQLFVFSDGKAEDTAFSADDVIARALAADVAVTAIVYPPVEGSSLAAQSLRRIAEATGGSHVRVGAVGDVEGGLVDRPFAPLLDGRRVRVDLMAPSDVAGGRQEVMVRLTDGAGRQVDLTFVADVEAAPPPPEPPPEPTTREDAAEVVRAGEGEEESEVPWLALVLAAASTLGVGVLVAWFVYEPDEAPSTAPAKALTGATAAVAAAAAGQGRAKPSLDAPPQRGAAPMAVLATIEVLGANARSIAVIKPMMKIGRHPDDNDIVIDDRTVSDHHAVLHQLRDGSFAITDTRSRNGVEVNGQKVETALLEEGTVVELGDTRLRFRGGADAGAGAPQAPQTRITG